MSMMDTHCVPGNRSESVLHVGWKCLKGSIVACWELCYNRPASKSHDRVGCGNMYACNGHFVTNWTVIESKLFILSDFIVSPLLWSLVYALITINLVRNSSQSWKEGHSQLGLYQPCLSHSINMQLTTCNGQGTISANVWALLNTNCLLG